MGYLGQMTQLCQMDQMAQMGQMDQMAQMGKMTQMDQVAQMGQRDQDQIDSMIYSKMVQMDQMANLRNPNRVRPMMSMEMDSMRRKLSKREAESSFEYTVASGPPKAQSEYTMMRAGPADMTTNRLYLSQMVPSLTTTMPYLMVQTGA